MEASILKFIQLYQNTDECTNYQKLVILDKAFEKINLIIETNKERMDILGSDFVSESEDETQVRNCFDK